MLCSSSTWCKSTRIAIGDGKVENSKFGKEVYSRPGCTEQFIEFPIEDGSSVVLVRNEKCTLYDGGNFVCDLC
jgi:hypothetical protein